MRIDILTLFPEMVRAPLQHSIVGRAIAGGLASIVVHDLRDWTTDRRRSADDIPYGGGAGMVMSVAPLTAAIRALRGDSDAGYRVLLCPQGDRLTQASVANLALHPHVIFVCGHYEGIDDRVRSTEIDCMLSLGDYVLSGGELAALVVVDAIIRLLPGALGSPDSAIDESHTTGLLEYPHFTRPVTFEGQAVPSVLLSGHHAAITQWRNRASIAHTRNRRPDLYARWWVRERLASLDAPQARRAPRRPKA